MSPLSFFVALVVAVTWLRGDVGPRGLGGPGNGGASRGGRGGSGRRKNI